MQKYSNRQSTLSLNLKLDANVEFLLKSKYVCVLWSLFWAWNAMFALKVKRRLLVLLVLELSSRQGGYGMIQTLTGQNEQCD